jgi:hypothetical protein
MHQPENRTVLRLLVKAYNCAITDYFYFPEVIYAGTQKVERTDFEFLLSEGLIQLSKFDSFGRYYRLHKAAFIFTGCITGPAMAPAACCFFDRLGIAF